MAFSFLQRAAKGFRFSGIGGSRGGMNGWGGWFHHRLPGARYDYAREAGNLWQNSIILSAIKWQCRTFPEAPQVVYREGQDGKPKIQPHHPALGVWRNPNPYYSASVLTAGILLSLGVQGDAYLFKLRNAIGEVIGLLYIPHFQVKPVWPSDGSAFISGYEYRVDGVLVDTWKPEDVIHLRDGVDPMNMRCGLSPTAAILREVCTENEASTAAAALMRNLGLLGVMVAPKVPTEAGGINFGIDKDQADALKRMWRERTTGEERGTPIVPTVPMEVSNVGYTPSQLAFDKVRALPVSRICAAMLIDPMVLGLPSESKTYQNYAEAREAAYESNIIPLQRIIDEQLTLQLMPDFITPGQRKARDGDYYGRDYSQVRVLQEDRDALYKRLNLAVGGPFLTPNEARQELGYAKIDEGDELNPAPGATPEPDEGSSASQQGDSDGNAQGEDDTDTEE